MLGDSPRESAKTCNGIWQGESGMDIHNRTLASYPGPFTRAARAGREIRAWYQSFAHA